MHSIPTLAMDRGQQGKEMPLPTRVGLPRGVFGIFNALCTDFNPDLPSPASLGALMWLLSPGFPPDFQENIHIPTSAAAGEVTGLWGAEEPNSNTL